MVIIVIHTYTTAVLQYWEGPDPPNHRDAHTAVEIEQKKQRPEKHRIGSGLGMLPLLMDLIHSIGKNKCALAHASLG